MMFITKNIHMTQLSEILEPGTYLIQRIFFFTLSKLALNMIPFSSFLLCFAFLIGTLTFLYRSSSQWRCRDPYIPRFQPSLFS